MHSRPLIGVTGNVAKENARLNISGNYMEGLYACGAFPVLLPVTGDGDMWLQAVQELDGFLFSGGVDIDARYFGEETLQCCGEISPARDKMELDLLKAVLPSQKPVLGICRGLQLMNIGLGGTIYQDINAQNAQPIPMQHRQNMPEHLPSHDVLIEEGSLLHRIVKTTRLPVNSLHHQAVKSCGPGLCVVAKASTGLTEALEKKDHPFFLGVQWHPEMMWPYTAQAKAILQSFVDACAPGNTAV
jgi:putative glutamine amidotransferase